MQRKLASPLARRVPAAVLVGAALACAGPGARADGARPEGARPPIVLVLDPCAAVDAQEVRRLVPIEMGAPLAVTPADPADATPADTTRVFVGCVVGSPQLVRLEVRDPKSGRRVDRVITLVGDSKTDQARLVAIVAVELVATSRSELNEPAPAPVAAPAPDPRALAVTVTPPPPAPPPRARWRLLGEGSLRHVAGLPHLLPGGGLALARLAPSGLGLGADVLVEGGAEPTALGDVDALLVSASLVGAWRLARGPFAWESAMGARGGVARLAGRAPTNPLATPVRQGVVSAPWAGPLLAGRASAALGHGVCASLGGELGYVASAVAGHVQGQPDIAVSGAWWSVVVGVGYER